MAYEEIGLKGKNMLINYNLLDYSSPGGCISQAHNFYIYLYFKDHWPVYKEVQAISFIHLAGGE